MSRIEWEKVVAALKLGLYLDGHTCDTIMRIVAAHTVQVEEPVTEEEITHQYVGEDVAWAFHSYEAGYRAGAARRGRG